MGNKHADIAKRCTPLTARVMALESWRKAVAKAEWPGKAAMRLQLNQLTEQLEVERGARLALEARIAAVELLVAVPPAG